MRDYAVLCRIKFALGDHRLQTETEACMSGDAEPKMSGKDWEQTFPPLLVA
jgi:hypothetical protein